MVRLYLLGFTHDLKGVVFSQRRGGKTASFWVPIDDSFMTAVTKLEQARRNRASSKTGKGTGKAVVGLDDLPKRSRALPPVGRSEPRGGLPASEIQQMLREGKSIKTVAAAAKTDMAWVERLAEPVLSERIGVVRLAQRAYMHRPRLGTAGLQLGEAVRRNLEERRGTIEGLDDAWDAKAMASGVWRVWVRFSHRGKRRSAEWEFKKGSRSISPRNRLAADIGWWAPDAPVPAPVQEGAEGEGEEVAAGERPKPKRRRRPAAAKRRRKAAARRPAQRKRPAPTRTKRPASKKKPAKRGSRRPATRRRR